MESRAERGSQKAGIFPLHHTSSLTGELAAPWAGMLGEEDKTGESWEEQGVLGSFPQESTHRDRALRK